MADHKMDLVNDVTVSLVTKLEPGDLETVTDEMLLALRNYDVTKHTTDIVTYDGFNEKIIKRFVACLQISGRSEKTIAQYERAVKKLFGVLQKNFTDMTVSDIRLYLAFEKNRGISNVTLNTTRSILFSFFSWLIDEELIVKNPLRTIAPIKCEEKVRLPFSSVEIDAMRSACRTSKERAIIEVLLSSGVRVSELCALTIADIDFDKLTVKVRKGKGSKQRTVYINDLAKRHLVEYLTERKQNGQYLFYNKRSEPLCSGGVRHILKVIEERAGITNVHPHRFRRTFATSLVNRGMNIQEISKILGHSDLNTTMTYVYTSDERIHISYMKYSA